MPAGPMWIREVPTGKDLGQRLAQLWNGAKARIQSRRKLTMEGEVLIGAAPTRSALAFAHPRF